MLSRVSAKLALAVALVGMAAFAGAALLPHPRLLLTPVQLAQLKTTIATQPQAAQFAASLLAAGENYLNAPLTAYNNCTVVGACRNAAVFGAGASYLNVGAAGGIIYTLALLHRLNASGPSQPSPWSKRAVAELLHISGDAWPSWYWPVGQALERATIAYYAGIGYDWLFDVMSPSERAAVVVAIGDRVLATRLRDERQGMWWTRDIYNWNVNANLLLLAATVAVADEPAVAAAAAATQAVVLESAASSMGASWGQDGIWPEGPVYSGYTLSSFAQGCGALATAHVPPLPTPPACAWAAGVCAAGRSAVLLSGATTNVHNWGDAHAEAPRSPVLFAAATQCANPVLAAAARSLRGGGGGAVEDLLWFSAAGSVAELDALPTAAVFADPSPDAAYGRKTHVGAFRSAWSWGDGAALQPNASAAVYVGFKGGQNHFDDHGSDSHNNHGHHDVGSFVHEAQGVRWAVDLGPDAYDYPLLAYFGRFRFGYALLHSGGHNVLSFDADTQHRRGSGGFTRWSVAPGAAPWAELDVTSAYGGAANVTRTFHLDYAAATGAGAGGDGAAACAPVRVVDSWAHPTAASATWTMHTTAVVNISASGDSVLLTAPPPEGAAPGALPPTLRLTAASQPRAVWAVETLQLLPPQATTYNGLDVYVVTATVPAAAGALLVTLQPCAASA